MQSNATAQPLILPLKYSVLIDTVKEVFMYLCMFISLFIIQSVDFCSAELDFLMLRGVSIFLSTRIQAWEY